MKQGIERRLTPKFYQVVCLAPARTSCERRDLKLGLLLTEDQQETGNDYTIIQRTTANLAERMLDKSLQFQIGVDVKEEVETFTHSPIPKAVCWCLEQGLPLYD